MKILSIFVSDSNTELMEIALLADMVKELILDNEEVALPGLGTFVTEVVPAALMICLPSCIQRLMGRTWKRPGR